MKGIGILLIALVICALCFNILGLLQLVSLAITLPVLFLSLFALCYFLTRKRQFKGMKKPTR
ncbi:hypothetical protein SAMN05421503_2309 [Terribacillus aidingensis]|uniref:Uncharacterized protein n=1 Tax=Terribacillus aidingensis TaxID=586416 RepID=A0A285P2A4_9BACI|nr:hypothetical protein [Terribacillus aidingensis]SNZ14286.1 hypothetical protein SAMN05421503_2309 [Terribacillus aidingensis]